MNWPLLARNDRHCGSPRMPGCLRAAGAAGVFGLPLFDFPCTFLLFCVLLFFPFWDPAAWFRAARCHALFPPRYRARRFLPGFLPCIVRHCTYHWRYTCRNFDYNLLTITVLYIKKLCTIAVTQLWGNVASSTSINYYLTSINWLDCFHRLIRCFHFVITFLF